MKPDWNYSELARAYLKRPSYSAEALDEMIELCGTFDGAGTCDLGAGTAHLTLAAVTAESGLFGNVRRLERTVLHKQSVTDVTQAWRSHATLQRQAGERFDAVERIAQMLEGLAKDVLEISYFTPVWLAPERS